MYLYSGYIDCGAEPCSYEFESDLELDTMGQLTYLLDTGILQIVDNRREELDDE